MRTLTTFLSLTLLISTVNAQNTNEQNLLNLTNQHRIENHLPPLTPDVSITKAAQAHAERMSQEKGEPQHQYPNEPDLATRASQAGARFSSISENIAAGPLKINDIDRSWMKSDALRALILDPNATAIGISVIEKNGSLYAVQDIAQGVSSITPEDIENKVQKLLQDQGINTITSADAKQDARNSCKTRTSSAPNAILVMQWDGSDLTKLPATLLQQIPDAAKHNAAVGACPTKNETQGFTTYHVAVVLFY